MGRKQQKVAHLTSVHHPYDTRILLKECMTLAAAGYEVVLIAPYQHSQEVEGVRLRAIAKPCNRQERFLHTIRQVYRAAVDEQAALYHFHDPELLPVGLLLQARGHKVIHDVHEDVAKDILSKYWLAPWVRQPLSRVYRTFEAMATRFLEAIVPATPDIAKNFARHHPVTVVQNFPILDELTTNGRHVPYRERPATVAYVGSLQAVRGVEEMIQAIGLLPDALNVNFVIAGPFSPPSLQQEAERQNGWQRVEYLGWQPRHEVARLLGGARLGLVTFLPAPNHVASQPNKLFEYMSAGLPVVASHFSLWREIVEGAQCGLVVDPQDPHAIAAAIQWILEHPEEAEAMGQRGQAAVRQRYNWDQEAAKLLNLYDKILA